MKIFTFFMPKNDLLGQFLDTTYFRAEGPIFLFFLVFLKKKYTSFFRAAEGGPKFFAPFFLAAEGGPIFFFAPFYSITDFYKAKN